jgi:hypothetical protein
VCTAAAAAVVPAGCVVAPSSNLAMLAAPGMLSAWSAAAGACMATAGWPQISPSASCCCVGRCQPTGCGAGGGDVAATAPWSCSPPYRSLSRSCTSCTSQADTCRLAIGLPASAAPAAASAAAPPPAAKPPLGST